MIPILNRISAPPADGWYQIEVTGEHPAGPGRTQVIDARALQEIVNRFDEQKSAAGESWGGMLVDADHLSHSLDNPTTALAWCHELAIRNGQLCGRLDLTDVGEAAIQNRRYKYFSTEYHPADLEDLGGGRVRPVRLNGLALTNRPNNRGGKPISNREDNPSGEPNETNNETPMIAIAEKLGLSAEATEADILAAIDAMMTKLAEGETKEATAEADAVMNRLGDRVPAAARPAWRERLIANRAETEPLMEQSFPPLKKVEPIFNRTAAQTPAAVEASSDPDTRAAQQQTVVNGIRNRDKCSHTVAWDQARRERPDLF